MTDPKLCAKSFGGVVLISCYVARTR